MISLEDHGDESYCDLFRSIPGIDVHDVSGFAGVDRLHEIRKRKYDVIVDLSGWTGGHFIAGLHAKIGPSPGELSWLFCLVGLSSMDYWLGDSQLFPDDIVNGHLSLCGGCHARFLAWTPHPLPEADIPVAQAPSGPIRFGSFNHNRKLSDATLMLWGQLMAAVPGSRLVLKASAGTDSDTQRLLRRRMLRQDLILSEWNGCVNQGTHLNTCSNMLKLILLLTRFPMVAVPLLVKLSGWAFLRSPWLDLITSVE